MTKKILIALFSGILLLNAPVFLQAEEDDVATISDYERGEEISSAGTMYEEGMYKIGTDMPPGEYVLITDGSSNCSFHITSDANQEDTIEFDLFDYDAIVTVSSGQFLEFSNSYAVALEDAEPLDLTRDGMFKIGTHLAPGEYKVIADRDSSCACYIYNDNEYWDLANMKLFDNSTYVSVEDGQYLQLSNCHIENPIAPGEEGSVLRTKANTGVEFTSNCIVDELGWVEDVAYTGESLRTFYDITGVQPFVYFMAYDESITTDEEKETYAEAWYDQNIDNEGTFLYIYFAEEDASNDIGYMYCVDGYDIVSVMDSEAIETFWDYVNEYWFDGDLSTDEFLINVFDSTAKAIMQEND